MSQGESLLDDLLDTHFNKMASKIDKSLLDELQEQADLEGLDDDDSEDDMDVMDSGNAMEMLDRKIKMR